MGNAGRARLLEFFNNPSTFHPGELARASIMKAFVLINAEAGRSRPLKGSSPPTLTS